MFQLTNRTFSILKNFSQISDNLLIYPGSTLRTVSRAMTFGASAKISEEFPCEFPIYFLQQMLSVIHALGTNVFIDFHERHAMFISPDKKAKVRWLYSEPSQVHGAPNKDINVTPIGELVMSKEQYNQIRGIGSSLENPDVLFRVTPEGASIRSTNMTKQAPQEMTIEIDRYSGQPFHMSLKLDNFAIVPDEYVVQTDGKRVLRFVSQDLTYWSGSKEIV